MPTYTLTHTGAELDAAIAKFISGGGGIELPDTITAGDTPIMFIQDTPSVTSTSFTATGLKLTVPRDGTYRFTSRAVRYNTSGTTNQGQFYKNGTAVSGTTASFESGKYTAEMQADIQCAAGDTVEVYLKARSSSYPTAAYYLVACIDWDNGWSSDSGGSTVQTITFTISSSVLGTKTYTAESGMTWGEWVESSYNTNKGSVYVNGGYVQCNAEDLMYNYKSVLPTDVIVANATYKDQLTEDDHGNSHT